MDLICEILPFLCSGGGSTTTSTVDIGGQLAELSSAGGPAIQTDLGRIIGSFIGAIILIGAIAAMGYMFMAGIQWITAGGDTGKIEKARSKFVQSIIGLGLLASTYAIFLVVQYFFGINITGPVSGGSGGGGGTGTAICTPGQTGHDGGNGGYCSGGGKANMKCFGPGEIPGWNEAHWEPCSCNPPGTEKPGYNFDHC